MRYNEPPRNFSGRRNVNAVRAIMLFLLAGLLFVSVARAQSTPTGTLTGVVQDINGAAVPNATVTAKNTGTATARSVTSDGEGRWTIPALPVGTYDVMYDSTLSILGL